MTEVQDTCGDCSVEYRTPGCSVRRSTVRPRRRCCTSAMERSKSRSHIGFFPTVSPTSTTQTTSMRTKHRCIHCTGRPRSTCRRRPEPGPPALTGRGRPRDRPGSGGTCAPDVCILSVLHFRAPAARRSFLLPTAACWAPASSSPKAVFVFQASWLTATTGAAKRGAQLKGRSLASTDTPSHTRSRRARPRAQARAQPRAQAEPRSSRAQPQAQ